MTTLTKAPEKIFKQAQDFMPINGTDYIELYVSNAKQAAHYYKTAFGFQSFEPFDRLSSFGESQRPLETRWYWESKAPSTTEFAYWPRC